MGHLAEIKIGCKQFPYTFLDIILFNNGWKILPELGRDQVFRVWATHQKKSVSSCIFGFKQCYKPKNSSIGCLEVIFRFQKFWGGLPFFIYLDQNKVSYKKSASLVVWKCIKNFTRRVGGGGPANNLVYPNLGWDWVRLRL